MAAVSLKHISAERCTFVGPSYCQAEMYAGSVAYCPWWVTVSMPTGQTDRPQTVTLRFPIDAVSVKNYGTYTVDGLGLS